MSEPRDPLVRRLLAERAAASEQLRRGDLTAVDTINRVGEHLALIAGQPWSGPVTLRPSPVVPVVLGRAGVHLLPAGLVPPELHPSHWSEARGGYAPPSPGPEEEPAA